MNCYFTYYRTLPSVTVCIICLAQTWEILQSKLSLLLLSYDKQENIKNICNNLFSFHYRLIQGYVIREESGTLASDDMDANKVFLFVICSRVGGGY